MGLLVTLIILKVVFQSIAWKWIKKIQMSWEKLCREILVALRPLCFSKVSLLAPEKKSPGNLLENDLGTLI